MSARPPDAVAFGLPWIAPAYRPFPARVDGPALSVLTVFESSNWGIAGYFDKLAITYELAAGQEKFEPPKIGAAEYRSARVGKSVLDASPSPLGEVSR